MEIKEKWEIKKFELEFAKLVENKDSYKDYIKKINC